jgi:hypothetical protein
MARAIGGAVAGLTAWLALWALTNLILTYVWPAYAAALPHRAFTLEMLFVRLALGTLVTLVAGATAARVAKGERKAALWFGLLLLFVGVADHIQIWDKYPVWYHLLFFAGIVPLAFLGGRLAGPRLAR